MVSVFKWISKRALATAGPFLLAAAAMATIPAGAQAGQFHVYSCRTPSGESAPADGWSGSKSGAETTAEDTCSQPKGALIAALGDQAPRTANADTATWTFGVPVGETVAGATLWRAGDTLGGTSTNATYQFWLAGSNPTEIFEECLYAVKCQVKGIQAQPLSSENRVAVPSANLGPHLYMTASCGAATRTAMRRRCTCTRRTSPWNRRRGRRRTTWAANLRARRRWEARAT